jgi:hypothetical protein
LVAEHKIRSFFPDSWKFTGENVKYVCLIFEVIENRVLRRMFGPKRDEVTGEFRKLHK